MKSLSKVFALICIAMMLLAACGPAATEAPATQPPAEPTMAATEAPTEVATEAATEASATEAATEAATQAASGSCPLEVEDGATITFSGWGDETEQKIYRDTIDRFQALCPGVTVDYQPIPADFQNKLKAQMAGGTAPDVFYVDDQLMNAFQPSGQLLELDDYMAQAGVSRDDFIPQLLTIFTVDGKTYGLPKDWARWAWSICRKHFRMRASMSPLTIGHGKTSAPRPKPLQIREPMAASAWAQTGHVLLPLPFRMAALSPMKTIRLRPWIPLKSRKWLSS